MTFERIDLRSLELVAMDKPPINSKLFLATITMEASPMQVRDNEPLGNDDCLFCDVGKPVCYLRPDIFRRCPYDFFLKYIAFSQRHT